MLGRDHLIASTPLQAEARSLAVEREGAAADMEVLHEELRAREAGVAERESQLWSAEAALAEQRREMSAAVSKAASSTFVIPFLLDA